MNVKQRRKLALNRSKINDPRYWKIWRDSGAVGTVLQITTGKKSTLISETELKKRCKKEGIDFSKVCAIVPRWAESTPLKKGVRSALVHCDLIIRSDGSFVFLDGAMGIDSMTIADQHAREKANPNNLGWDDYAASLTELS